MRKALNGKYPKLVCPGCGHGTLSRRLGAEFVGTAILLTAIVGSAATADALSGGNLAAVVFINAVATGLTLITLIMIFGPISGAHFNPAVTLVDVLIGGSTWPHAGAYVAAQLAGAVVGIMIVHGMHELSLLSLSGQVRSGSGVMVGEFVATFGLLAVILGCMQFRKSSIAFAVGFYITGSTCFASSAAFANPVVTIARMFTDTVAGIRPVDAPAFILFEFLGALAALGLFLWFRQAPGLATETTGHSGYSGRDE